MKEIFLIIFGFVALVLGIFYGVILLDSASCTNVGEQMQVESKYRTLGGCFLKIDNKWVSTRFIRDMGLSERNEKEEN